MTPTWHPSCRSTPRSCLARDGRDQLAQWQRACTWQIWGYCSRWRRGSGRNDENFWNRRGRHHVEDAGSKEPNQVWTICLFRCIGTHQSEGSRRARPECRLAQQSGDLRPAVRLKGRWYIEWYSWNTFTLLSSSPIRTHLHVEVCKSMRQVLGRMEGLWLRLGLQLAMDDCCVEGHEITAVVVVERLLLHVELHSECFIIRRPTERCPTHLGCVAV